MTAIDPGYRFGAAFEISCTGPSGQILGRPGGMSHGFLSALGLLQSG